MLSGLWLGILLGFGVLVDHTVQNSHIANPFYITQEIKEEIIYYDRIEVIGYDMFLPVKDSTLVFHERNKK